MKFVLLIALALGAAFVYPARHEGTHGACTALERHLALSHGTAAPPDGSRASAMVHETVPFLPAEAGCALAYWASLIRPGLGEAFRADMLLKRQPAAQ